MNLLIKQIILLLLIFCLSNLVVFSQNHSSRNNYTGAWEDSSSWNPIWAQPLTILTGHNVTINGYITVNDSLSFSGSPNRLSINDTLVVEGNLFLGNNSRLTIADNGILIVVAVRNQYGISLPFFVIPIGGVPVYSPKIRMK
jgi:hypothetical protein